MIISFFQTVHATAAHGPARNWTVRWKCASTTRNTSPALARAWRPVPTCTNLKLVRLPHASGDACAQQIPCGTVRTVSSRPAARVITAARATQRDTPYRPTNALHGRCSIKLFNSHLKSAVADPEGVGAQQARAPSKLSTMFFYIQFCIRMLQN